MHDETGRFVDRDEIVVFIEDVEDDGFGLRSGSLRDKRGRGGAAPLINTSPASIQRWMRFRDAPFSSRRWRSRTRSRRTP
jgi:hypothetical protein